MRVRLLPSLLLMLVPCMLAACDGASTSGAVTVVVQPAPLEIGVEAEGQLKAASSTSLTVPGPSFSQRQVAAVVPDGSRVAKGDVVARFSAKQSKQDLAEAVIDVTRNRLEREGKQADLDQTGGQLRVDLAQVASQLAIAERYAHATIAAVARNQILDAIQDKHYLDTRQGILQWRKRQSGVRGKAELGVVDARHATLALKARQARDDLDALVLHAPHDGIVMLKADWSGQKPRVGAAIFAGRPFAELPDLADMQVLLQVPQVQAQGLRPGLPVQLHPLGAPEASVTAHVSWVAATASPVSRQSPVKYLAVKVPLPAGAAKDHGWMPGMLFHARIVLADADAVLSVPNLALDTHGDTVRVRVLEHGKPTWRDVTLGVRGPARSEVVSGLQPGDRVVLADAEREDAS